MYLLKVLDYSEIGIVLRLQYSQKRNSPPVFSGKQMMGVCRLDSTNNNQEHKDGMFVMNLSLLIVIPKFSAKILYTQVESWMKTLLLMQNITNDIITIYK